MMGRARADAEARISGCVVMKDDAYATNRAILYGALLLDENITITGCELVSNCAEEKELANNCPERPVVTGCV